MTEQEGDRTGQICAGKCVRIPIWTGTVSFDCYNHRNLHSSSARSGNGMCGAKIMC